MNQRRPYHSPVRTDRARRTRDAILASARELFVSRGYAGTSIRAVAEAAGMSVPAVEQAFGTKRALLKVVVDVTTAADDDQVPMLQRPAVLAADASATTTEFLDRATTVIGEVAARVGGVHAVVAAAAVGDVEIAELAAEIDARRRVVAEWLVAGVARRAVLRLDRRRARDTVWVLLDPVVHRRLLDDCGWASTDLARWLAETLERLLVAESGEPGLG